MATVSATVQAVPSALTWTDALVSPVAEVAQRITVELITVTVPAVIPVEGTRPCTRHAMLEPKKPRPWMMKSAPSSHVDPAE